MTAGFEEKHHCVGVNAMHGIDCELKIHVIEQQYVTTTKYGTFEVLVRTYVRTSGSLEILK